MSMIMLINEFFVTKIVLLLYFYLFISVASCRILIVREPRGIFLPPLPRRTSPRREEVAVSLPTAFYDSCMEEYRQMRKSAIKNGCDLSCNEGKN